MKRIVRKRFPIVGVLLLYWFGAVWLALHHPAYAAPNELLQFEYVRVMRQIGGLPNRGLVNLQTRYNEWHQPPLYYTVAALTTLSIDVEPAPNPPPPIETTRNPFFMGTRQGNLNIVIHESPQSNPLLYTSRIAASLFGAVGVAAMYLAGKRVFSAERGTDIGLLLAALLAFHPNYLFFNAVSNNDGPLVAIVACVLAMTVVIVQQFERGFGRNRHFIYLGFLCALALLTKANGVFTGAFIGGVCLVRWWRTGKLWAAIQAGLYALVGLVPPYALLLVRNALMVEDVLGVSGSLPASKVLGMMPPDFLRLGPFMANIGRSFWLDWSAGDVGYGPTPFYLVSGGLVVVALLGWFRRDRLLAPKGTHLPLILGGLAISYLYFAVKALTVKGAGYLVPEGRWLLPGLPVLIWFVGVGWAKLWPRRIRPIACHTLAAFAALALYGLMMVYFPTLYPSAEKVSAAAIDTPVQATFDEQLRLVSVSAPDEFMVGEPVEVTLVWEALVDIEQDYSVSAQIIAFDPQGWQMLDSQNSYPGNGLTPTRGWRQGDLWQDVVTLQASDVPAPIEAVIWLVVSDEEGPVEPTGQSAKSIVVRPQPQPIAAGDAQTPIFGDAQISGARGYEIDGSRLTLNWQALGSVGVDYTVFAHLYASDGSLLSQADNRPNRGLSPTTIWRAGDIIADVHDFAVEPPADGYFLVGFYDPTNGSRLPLTVDGSPIPDATWRIDVTE